MLEHSRLYASSLSRDVTLLIFVPDGTEYSYLVITGPCVILFTLPPIPKSESVCSIAFAFANTSSSSTGLT